MVGAAVIVVLPELISSLAEYRLLAFGALLLWCFGWRPKASSACRAFSRIDGRRRKWAIFRFALFWRPRQRQALTVDGLSIAFGGVGGHRRGPDRRTRAHYRLDRPQRGRQDHRAQHDRWLLCPDAGSIRLGKRTCRRRAASVARAGIARTYQTTQLFGSLSVLDNVLLGLRRGRLGNPFAAAAGSAERRAAEGLLAFVGYKGPLGVPARDLPHVDRRLVEIARALATRPSVLLLDEPAAGLMRADKVLLAGVLRQLADAGLAVILVEHDMALVMGLSDHVVVLDAGRPIAAGTPDGGARRTPGARRLPWRRRNRGAPALSPAGGGPTAAVWRPRHSVPVTARCPYSTGWPSRSGKANS